MLMLNPSASVAFSIANHWSDITLYDSSKYSGVNLNKNQVFESAAPFPLVVTLSP